MVPRKSNVKFGAKNTFNINKLWINRWAALCSSSGWDTTMAAFTMTATFTTATTTDSPVGVSWYSDLTGEQLFVQQWWLQCSSDWVQGLVFSCCSSITAEPYRSLSNKETPHSVPKDTHSCLPQLQGRWSKTKRLFRVSVSSLIALCMSQVVTEAIC